MGNPVVQFHLSAPHPDVVAGFYEALLSWRVRETRLTSVEAGIGGTFRWVQTGGGVPGGIALEPVERGVVLIVQVEDVETTLHRAGELGATVHGRETFSIEGAEGADGVYELGWITDPAGNRMALARSRS